MNSARRKLLNAILFFSKNTQHLGITKLSKLLYFFDFEHYGATGYPAIGLDYHAFDRGPVPKKLWLELKEGSAPADMADKLLILDAADDWQQDSKGLKFVAKAEPDLRVFTPREKKIIFRLAEIYREVLAKDMSEISHLENQPWDKTRRSKGANALIDYRLAHEAKTAEELLEEFFAVEKNFSISSTR